MPLNTFAAASLLCVLAVAGVATQTAFKEPPVTNEAWTRPFPGFRVVGNVYYVGTYDLASYLITTDQGHILVNTGVGSSAPMIRANVESLGFRVGDIKLLLATHGHWDHVGAMAPIKRLTGARMLMHEADVPVLEDGGHSDFRFFPKGRGTVYEPVTVDQRLKAGRSVQPDTVRRSRRIPHGGRTDRKALPGPVAEGAAGTVVALIGQSCVFTQIAKHL